MSMGKKKVIPLAIFLLFAFTFNLSRAQSESELLSEQFELASAQLSETEALSPVISMDFQDAVLKDILKVFSQQAGLNFIASENIKDRKVTLYLEKVTVEDALNTIMSANNLTYEQEKDSKIFVVKEWGRPATETVTKVFPLQYALVKEYEFIGKGEKKVKKLVKQVGIKEVIEKLLTEHGQMIEDERTNSLVITDIPSQFPKIEKTIKELDIKLPQVMIEVEIIETSLEAIDKLGIEWGSADEGELGSTKGAMRVTQFPFTKPQEMRKVGGTGVSGGTAGFISAANLTAALAMLSKDTNTKILARPRILTLNNKTAEINITTNMVMQVKKETDYDDEGNPIEVTWTPERSNAVGRKEDPGISLAVTPTISSDGTITMKIEPAVRTITASTIVGDLEQEVGKYYDLDERTAKTTVMVNNGETVIIGGLIHTQDTKRLRKVPFFGDIPLLGYLFRKKDDITQDKELIIFITPHLVKEGAKHAGLAQKQMPWEYERLGLKEEAMEGILDKLER